MTVLTVDQILSGPALGLNAGLADLLVLEVGGRGVLYALSRAEGRLLEVEIGTDGTLDHVGGLVLEGTIPAGDVPVLGAFADHAALTVAGLAETDGQAVALSGTGALGTQVALSGLGKLGAAVGLDLDGTSGLVHAAGTGLTLATDTGGGYVPVAGLADTSARYLGGIAAGTGFTRDGTAYAATVSDIEDGVNIAAVTASGLTQTGALGPLEGLPIDVPQDIAAIQRGGETLLAIAASGTHSVSIVRVEGGVPSLADHALDSAATRFAGAAALAATTHGDFAYLAAGGAEGGVSLLTVLPGGRLVHLASLAESETVPLDRVSSLEMVVAGAALHILTASEAEAGISRLTYDLAALGAVVEADGSGTPASGTPGDDQVIGSDVSEALSGGAGADILLDGAGEDTLTGGAGADLFAFAADGQNDTVTDFERGVDRLDLSAFDFLHDVSALSVTPTADGAVLSHGDETLTLITADAAPITVDDLSNDDILNIDRPPLLAIGQALSGGGGGDTLNGGSGNDTILGAAGDDSLSGLYGDDGLQGGAGRDSLDGGPGDDTLQGQDDADTLAGGAGNDLLTGGGGDDMIYGDDYDWSGG